MCGGAEGARSAIVYELGAEGASENRKRIGRMRVIDGRLVSLSWYPHGLLRSAP